ncbi:MAG: hypothetical protein ASARMPRED_004722 [Alectoria sarmentosa]|nr:MAG: hypothetical protein ASARMPRED_004722 [Alectoria sarmentosa]
MASDTRQVQKHRPSDYPGPLVVPASATHRQTFIILHGRGSNAASFGPDLLATKVSTSPDTLKDAFPHVKFIFPTASKRRAVIYNRSVINQWFDNWSLQTPTKREELQINGLRETSAYIHNLLRGEMELVGASNVVLGGLSQGCAASLISLLTWDGPPLAAVFGMCGWLPFRKQMKDIAQPSSDCEDNEDLFARSDQYEDVPPAAQAGAFLREELEMSPAISRMSFQDTPVFLGHGTKDEKVPINLGREAADCLKSMGVEVFWKDYDDLGHWYSITMLDDLVAFLEMNGVCHRKKILTEQGVVGEESVPR